MDNVVTLESLYKLIGTAVTVIGFLITAATVYLRLYIKNELALFLEKIRAEIKADYLTKIEGRTLEKDIARLEPRS